MTELEIILTFWGYLLLAIITAAIYFKFIFNKVWSGGLLVVIGLLFPLFLPILIIGIIIIWVVYLPILFRIKFNVRKFKR